MPSFGELHETVALWKQYPGRDRCAAGVALTFDDGPDPEGTPAVLEALAAADATATFFLVGEQLLAHHELGAEIVAAGHAVGLHAMTHVVDEGADELQRGLDAVEAATGARPRLYRPPYGRFGPVSFDACSELGLEPVYWSSWGLDWEPLGAERIAELVARDSDDGAIVLLHDSARYAPRASAAATADAIPAIVAEIRSRALDLAAID